MNVLSLDKYRPPPVPAAAYIAGQHLHEAIPLRVVIGYYPQPALPGIPEPVREVYECGHMARSKLDIYGETYASRRRCSVSATGRAADLNPLKLGTLRKT